MAGRSVQSYLLIGIMDEMNGPLEIRGGSPSFGRAETRWDVALADCEARLGPHLPSLYVGGHRAWKVPWPRSQLKARTGGVAR